MKKSIEKERILRAAADRFMEHGFHKATVDEMAADLRMSKKTVYKFFPSKEVLLKAIVKALTARIEREVDSIVSSNKPFEEKMVAMFVLVGNVLRRFSRQLQFDIQRSAPHLWKEIETFRREKIFSKLNIMFQQAKRDGVFRDDLNTELFFLVFTTSVQGIVNPAVLSQHSFSTEEAFKGIFKIMFEGALSDEARKKVRSMQSAYSEPQHVELI